MTVIASWNVNSVNARLEHLLRWLKDSSPDVVLLQELKCVEEKFPRLEIEDAGYNVAVAGQKAYNGVAILSKTPIEVERTTLPGDDSDIQARYIEAFTGSVRLASIYLPNGNPVPGDKFDYKLDWMERLYRHAKNLLDMGEALVLGGDYNVIPEEEDVYNPASFINDALFQPQSRAALRKIIHLGFTDAYRAITPEGGQYTWWSYRAGAWNKNNGLRIDHLLLSPQAADRLQSCDIHRPPRGWERPSDHTPIWCELTD